MVTVIMAFMVPYVTVMLFSLLACNTKEKVLIRKRENSESEIKTERPRRNE